MILCDQFGRILRIKEEKVLWDFNINDPHLFKINEKEAIDIDTIQEFKLAELLYKENKLDY